MTKNIYTRKTKINPIGVKLSIDELLELDKAAAQLDCTRHHLLHYAVLCLLRDWKNGKIQPTTRKVLDFPEL